MEGGGDGECAQGWSMKEGGGGGPVNGERCERGWWIPGRSNSGTGPDAVFRPGVRFRERGVSQMVGICALGKTGFDAGNGGWGVRSPIVVGTGMVMRVDGASCPKSLSVLLLALFL